MAIVQWVNLEKNSDYLDDPDIDSLDRCGKLSVKTAFSSGDVDLSYKVKVTEVGSDNATYNAKELGRNSNFKMTQGTSDLATDTEVLIEGDIQLPAAGGNKYKLEAKDANGTPVSSEEIETKRRLYCQIMTMNDKKGKVPPYALDPLFDHLEQYHIYLKAMPQKKSIPYFKTIHSGNQLNFANEVKKAYDIPDSYQKVGVAIIYSDYISDYIEASFDQTMAIGSSHPQIIVTATEVTIILNYYLWFGLDAIHDDDKKFFIDGRIRHELASTKIDYLIEPTDVEISGEKLKTSGGYHQVKIKRNDILDKILNQTSGVLHIEMDFNRVASWTNGFSWNPWSDGFKLITVSRRPGWEEMSDSSREQVWNHEIGHRLGMTSYGNKLAHDNEEIAGSSQLPDGPSTFYYDISDGKNYGGHRGPHCSKGATYDSGADSWSGIPECVMFGADAIGDNATEKDYCDVCKKIPSKLDLSA